MICDCRESCKVRLNMKVSGKMTFLKSPFRGLLFRNYASMDRKTTIVRGILKSKADL